MSKSLLNAEAGLSEGWTDPRVYREKSRGAPGTMLYQTYYCFDLTEEKPTLKILIRGWGPLLKNHPLLSDTAIQTPV